MKKIDLYRYNTAYCSDDSNVTTYISCFGSRRTSNRFEFFEHNRSIYFRHSKIRGFLQDADTNGGHYRRQPTSFSVTAYTSRLVDKIMFMDTNYIMGYRCTPIIDFFDTIEFLSPSNAVLNIRHCRCNSASSETSIRARDIFFNADGKITISRDQYNYVYNLPLIKTRVTDKEIRFSNGIVNLIGSTNPIANYDRVIFENQYITYPPNTYYDTTTNTFGNPFGILDSLVISGEYTQPYLRPIYPITIAGTQVTVLNANNIVGYGISGHVSYDCLSNKLTLNNVSIFRSNYVGIQCDSSITIQCIGNNIVDGGDYSVLDHSKTALILNGSDNVIYGNGTNDTLQLLTYRNNEISSMYHLEISDLTLLALVGNGIYGMNNPDLTLNNC